MRPLYAHREVVSMSLSSGIAIAAICLVVNPRNRPAKSPFSPSVHADAETTTPSDRGYSSAVNVGIATGAIVAQSGIQ
jgi:hypothetical protein